MMKGKVLAILWLILMVMPSGCSVRLVSQYDADTEKAIVDTAKKTDLFYGKVLELPQDQRHYASLSDQYVSIETDIRSLVLRNEARRLNAESIEQSKILLNLWLGIKNDHRCRQDMAKLKDDNDRKELTAFCIKWQQDDNCTGFIDECYKTVDACREDCKNAVKLKWSKTEERLKDTYKTALARIDRAQLKNVFFYMLIGEKLKQDSAEKK
ncbi:MAG: hypothetical protein C0392_04630 [Syntrophus sp. (in: bacteria)]|nr:hypothetical protein [Syntrophus sp. (in: bacteria)]